MAKLSNLKASATHRVIVYGGPKTGKTLLAGKLAEHFKVIYVGLENGHATLFQLPEEWQSNVEIVNLPDTRSYPIGIETVLKMIKGKVVVCEAHGKVACMSCKKAEADTIEIDLTNLGSDTVVVFDSLTQIAASAMANICKGQPDDYKMQTDDWGNLAKLMEIFLSHIQQAAYNVVVISHEVEATTEGKKNVLVPVGGSKNSSRNVAKYFDHVIYAERKNKRHIFASGTDYATTILTGSRTKVCMEATDKAEEASLLAIFKPELYADRVITKDAKVTTTVSATTSSILERLKAKK